jgi:hypothetical protein
MDQVAHIQGLDAVPNTQKDSIIARHLTQAYFKNKHDLESSFDFPKCKSEAKIATSIVALVSSIYAHSQQC